MTAARQLPVTPSAAGRPSPDDVLDHETLSVLHDLGREPGKLLQELIAHFLAEAPDLLTEVEVAVGAGQCDHAGRAAHRLKGAAAHVGAVRLTLVADEVERNARAARREDTARAATTARSELDLAVTALRGLVA